MLSALGIFVAHATDTFRNIVGVSDVVGLQLFSLPPVRCVLELDYMVAFSLTVSLPFILAAFSIVLGVGVVAVKVFRARRARSKGTRDDTSGEVYASGKAEFVAKLRVFTKGKAYLTPVLFILFLSYNTVAHAAASMFKCRPEVVDGFRYLAADMSVTCYKPLHVAGVVGAAIVTIGFNLGYPLLLLLVLRKKKETLSTTATAQQLGFLYQGYSLHRGVYWWESVVMVRKLSVIMVGTLIEDAWYQIILSICILGFALILQLQVRPYDNPVFNRLESAILSVLCVTQVISLVYLRTESLQSSDDGGQQGVDIAFTIFLLLLNLAIIVSLVLLTVATRVSLLQRLLRVDRKLFPLKWSDAESGVRSQVVTDSRMKREGKEDQDL
jgi:hypothetical protein